MTTVVGILNKKGVAIAADSAVTRTPVRGESKYTKNGNKMIRLCEAVPISVMLTAVPHQKGQGEASDGQGRGRGLHAFRSG